MAKNGNGRGLFLWIGGAALLVAAGLFFLPKFMGKPAVAPVPVPAAVVNKPAQNFAVANAQYGYVPDMNFAGLAIEGPSNAMPLGFHINNVV